MDKKFETLVKKFAALEKRFFSLTRKNQGAVLGELGVDSFEHVRNLFDNSPAETVSSLESEIKKIHFNY
jgi:hypothetical protein